jgi:THO complex subunit 1
MPSAIVESHGVPAVASFGNFLHDLLIRAESVRPTASAEPPLDKSDFKDLQRQLSGVLGPELGQAGDPVDAKKAQRFAVIETAVRDTFSNLVVSSVPSHRGCQLTLKLTSSPHRRPHLSSPQNS